MDATRIDNDGEVVIRLKVSVTKSERARPREQQLSASRVSEFERGCLLGKLRARDGNAP